jgi:predicted PurR-regulated permease PerM
VIEKSTKRWLFWLGIGLGFLVFLYLIRSILLPFVLGILTAYFLDPVVDRLEKKKCSRTVATLLVTAIFFLIVTMALVLVTPLIADQLSGLLAMLPEYVAGFNHLYGEQMSRLLGGLPPEQVESFRQAASDMSAAMFKLLADFVTGLFQSGLLVVNLLSLILITPVVAFYLLRDWDCIVTRIHSLLPRPHEATIREQLAIIDDTLAGFIRGQMNVVLILGTYYALGLSLVGLKFGIVIGLLTGLLVIVPYVGFLVGMVLGLCVAFFQFDEYVYIFATLGVFLGGQVLEGYFLTPKLVGEKVGLHPVWIIFGMLAGGALFGFVGVLLAVPVTAVIGVLIRFATERYLQSSYYKGGRT